jgi:glycosyltransferase involved in cell wall biosynthesis
VPPLVLAIPTYNCARYLPATLESLNAEGEQVRWWLQDGGSTDGTLEVARRHARLGDTVVSEPDRGQSDALNRAMRQMGGEVIGFINGDDCLLPGASRTILDYFAAHPDVDLLCGGIQWIDEQGNVTGTHAGEIHSLEEVLDIYSVWWRNRQWVQPEVFYRRSLWERVGEFDTSYHLAFDYDFWVRCFLAGVRVAHLPDPLAQFRLHSAQKSVAGDRAANEIRDIVQKHLKTAPSLRPAFVRRLKAQLSYDFYRTAPDAPSFARSLLQHPEWLLDSAVRNRVGISLRKRLGIRDARSAGNLPPTDG